MKIKWILLVAFFLVLVFGAYLLLTQTRPAITKAAQVTLTILPKPDFSLEVTPSHIDAFVGRSDGIAFDVAVTSVNNFAGIVKFSVSGLPAGFTVTFFPDAQLTLGAGETKGVQVSVAVADDPALIGNYTLTITAESTEYN